MFKTESHIKRRGGHHEREKPSVPVDEFKTRWGYKLWVHPIYANIPKIKSSIIDPLYYETMSLVIYLGTAFSWFHLFGNDCELPKEPSVT